MEEGNIFLLWLASLFEGEFKFLFLDVGYKLNLVIVCDGLAIEKSYFLCNGDYCIFYCTLIDLDKNLEEKSFAFIIIDCGLILWFKCWFDKELFKFLLEFKELLNCMLFFVDFLDVFERMDRTDWVSLMKECCGWELIINFKYF